MIEDATNTLIFIGFDRDGTLETPLLPMSDKLKLKIIELEKSGINIFFASGKSMMQLKEIVKDIGVRSVLLCAENGGHICDLKKDNEFIVPINKDLKRFISIIEKHKLPKHKYEYKVSIWSRQFYDNVADAKKIIDEIIDKNKLNLNVFIHPDHAGGLDVVPIEIDKIKLLDFIPSNATIHYFGDSYNDFCLMKSERVIPYTMDNAKDAIKELVDKRGGIIANKSAGEGVLSTLCEILGD